MKKTIAILLLTVSTFITLFSQQDKKAHAILEKVSKKYKTYTSIKSSFSVTTKNKIDKSTKTEKGNVYLKGDKFKVDFGGQEIFCDSKTVWTYMKEANEVQIEKYVPKSNSFNPSDMFTLYQKGFNYVYVNSTTVGGKIIENLELTPKDKKKPYFKVKLQIDQSTSQIKSMEMMFKNGTTALYEITVFTPNAAIDNTFFTFDAKTKPGVEVNDLR